MKQAYMIRCHELYIKDFNDIYTINDINIICMVLYGVEPYEIHDVNEHVIKEEVI